MDPRARRHAIREHLSQARAAWETGDRIAALREVDAALRLDPDFLAAQALREHIARGPAPRPVTPAQEPISNAPIPVAPPPAPAPASARTPALAPAQTIPAAAPAAPVPAVRPPAAVPPPRVEAAARAANPDAATPVVSADGWARFEHRARSRRIDKRAEAAREAISRGRFEEAKAAIEEIRAIDATHPDIISLTMELDAAQHVGEPPSFRVGAAFAAVIVFASLILGGRWLGTPDAPPPAPAAESASMPTEPQTAPPVATSQPEVARADDVAAAPEVELSVDDPDPAPADTQPARVPAEPAFAAAVPEPSGTSSNDVAPPAVDRAERSFVWPPPAPPVTPPVSQAGTPLDSGVPPARGAADVAAAPPAAPAVAQPPVAVAVAPREVPAETFTPAPAPPPVSQPDVALASNTRAPAASVRAADEELVRRALQHYRLAYESLDARSARTVWPGVNQEALQRAFDGLVSQQLTFSDCNVQVTGATGAAVCRGSARYVPKVGSRDPRVEPRVWNFSLRKAGDDWQIESARTER